MSLCLQLSIHRGRLQVNQRSVCQIWVNFSSVSFNSYLDTYYLVDRAIEVCKFFWEALLLLHHALIFKVRKVKQSPIIPSFCATLRCTFFSAALLQKCTLAVIIFLFPLSHSLLPLPKAFFRHLIIDLKPFVVVRVFRPVFQTVIKRPHNSKA